VKKLLVLVAAAVILLAVSCDTKNVGNTALPFRGPIVTVTVPADMNGAEVHNWVVSWIGGTAPYTIEMAMGGGTTANVPAGTAAVSPFTQAFTMVNPSVVDDVNYNYTVTVTDAQGLSGTATAQYTVLHMLNQAPVIESAVFDAATDRLTVSVSDPDDGETLDVTVTVPAGLGVDDDTKTAAATGPLAATFDWTATDFVTGGSGTTTVTVSDGDATDTADVLITVDGFPLAPDTLYAFASPTSVATGDTVTVTIMTGDPANPFQYLNGVGLTIESDCDKVANSFNAGAVGGGAGDVDGFWTTMNPGGGFLLPPDNFIVATDIGGGRERWDFNLTPIGGSDVAAGEGALFSYQFTFSAAGTKTFGFQDINVVNRTYYSDSVPTEYFWGDITNADAPTVSVN
jgi:hypothetical protein